jgi:hypothetical protein
VTLGLMARGKRVDSNEFYEPINKLQELATARLVVNRSTSPPLLEPGAGDECKT